MLLQQKNLRFVQRYTSGCQAQWFCNSASLMLAKIALVSMRHEGSELLCRRIPNVAKEGLFDFLLSSFMLFVPKSELASVAMTAWCPLLRKYASAGSFWTRAAPMRHPQNSAFWSTKCHPLARHWVLDRKDRMRHCQNGAYIHTYNVHVSEVCSNACRLKLPKTICGAKAQDWRSEMCQDKSGQKQESERCVKALILPFSVD